MPSIPSSYKTPETIAAISGPAAASSDYRALVCVFLFGGADSHNMVVPLRGTNRTAYDTVRGVHAISVGSALPMTDDWGLHPNLAAMKTRYDAGDLAVLTNVGVLKEPTNRTTYLNGSVALPEQVFSHDTQQLLWQAAPGFAELFLTSGWMGRAGELAGDVYNPSSINDISSAFSVNGRVLQTEGYEKNANVMQTSGAITFGFGDGRTVATPFGTARDAARRRQEWNNNIQKVMRDRIAAAVDGQKVLADNLAALPGTADGRYSALSANSLAMQLKIVARIVNARSAYEHRRDVFFVSLGGWDHHENLNTQFAPLMTTVNDALSAFWLSINDLALSQNVTAFTQSDFGRTLVVNTTLGSDHGWGGHHLILGGAVKKGVYGSVDLTVNGPMDAGQGRLIPTTSVEQYAGELLRWWGIPTAQLPLVLENIDRFFPKTIPFMDEPLPTVATAPKIAINFMGGTLSPLVSFTRAGMATMFDASGNLVAAPCNLLPNSEFENPSVNPVNGTLSPVPGARFAGNYSTLFQHVVASGRLPNGRKYIDLRFYGTNPTAGVIYPNLEFSPGALIPVVAGQNYIFSLGAQIIAGTTTGLVANLNAQIMWLNNVGSFLNSTSATGNLDGTMKDLVVAGPLLSGAVNAQPIIGIQVGASASIDITFRLVEPMFNYSMQAVTAILKSLPSWRTKYVPTTGVKNDGPRFGYDRVTLKPRGLRVESQGSTQSLTNSVLAGSVVGTVGSTSGASPTNGTPPTGMEIIYGGSITGIVSSVVNRGFERGMPFVDLRFFGVASAIGSVRIGFVPLASPIAASAAQDWTLSCYMALKGGAFPAGSVDRLNIQGRNSGTFVEDSAATSLVSSDFGGLKNLPITHQRYQTTITIVSGTVNGITAEASISVAALQQVDFTIRIGAPQLEQNDTATSWIPSFGAVATRNGEVASIGGVPFTSVFNAVQGTLVIKGMHESVVDHAAGAINYPTFGCVSDGSSTNRIHLSTTSNVQQGVGSVTTAGSLLAGLTVTAPLILPEKPAVGAIAYKLNDTQVAFRGGFSAVDTSVALPTAGLINALYLGGSGGGVKGAWVQSVAYYDTRLTQEELIAITST